MAAPKPVGNRVILRKNGHLNFAKTGHYNFAPTIQTVANKAYVKSIAYAELSLK
jgi:hypothetical protein